MNFRDFLHSSMLHCKGAHLHLRYRKEIEEEDYKTEIFEFILNLINATKEMDEITTYFHRIQKRGVLRNIFLYSLK